MKEHQAIFDAYVQTTGLRISFKSYQRELDVKEIHERGITPDDVREVISKLKVLMRRKPDTYTPSCLEWRNCMGNVDRLEERIATIRQEKARREAARPKKQVARTDSTGVSRLDDQKPVDPKVIDVAAAFRNMADSLDKKAS